MDTTFFLHMAEDALFAAIAAIGFSTISHTPRRAWGAAALAAAVAHSLRFLLMSAAAGAMGITGASTLAAFAGGMVAVAMAPVVKVPAEACLFPALLPMIPGMYAYRSVEALLGCISSQAEGEFSHWLYLLDFNLFTCVAVVLGMVLGANLPIFMLKRISFRATR